MADALTEQNEQNRTNVRRFNSEQGEQNRKTVRMFGAEQNEQNRTPPIGGDVRFVRSCSSSLHLIADRIRRLAPSHRDPEAFHVEKGEIEAALRSVAEAFR